MSWHLVIILPEGQNLRVASHGAETVEMFTVMHRPNYFFQREL